MHITFPNELGCRNMSSLNQMAGTPWHIERYAREEGDRRRHRSRCVYYRKGDSHCEYSFSRCCGSAHCSHYCEDANKKVTMITKPKAETMHKTPKKSNKSSDRKVSEITLTSGTERHTSSSKSKKTANITDEEGCKMFPIGSKVKHKTLGVGTVISISNGRVTVKLEKKGKRVFGLNVCVKYGYLTELD